LLSLISRTGAPYRESFELPLDGAIEYWGQRYVSRGPLGVEVTAGYTGGRILVGVEVAASFAVPCSRCLAEAGLAIEGNLRYLFTLRREREEPEDSPRGEEDDGEIYVIPIDSFQSELDLSPYAWEVLCLSLPERALCSEDCRGLCPMCGQDLNERGCGCGVDDIDPRLAVLRGIES
jgi:uncharacterized protein